MVKQLFVNTTITMEIIDLTNEGVSYPTLPTRREARFRRMSEGVRPYHQCSIPELIDLIKNSSSYTRVNTLLKELRKKIPLIIDISMDVKLINLIYTMFRDAPLWIKNTIYRVFRSLIRLNHDNYIDQFNKLGGGKLMVDQLKSITYIHNVSQTERYIYNIIDYFEYCDFDTIQTSFLNNDGVDIFSNIYMQSTNIDCKESIIEFINNLMYENNECRYIRNELRENGILRHLLDNFIGHYDEELMGYIYCIVYNNIENIEYCRERKLINYLKNTPSIWACREELIECIAERADMESDDEDRGDELGDHDDIALFYRDVRLIVNQTGVTREEAIQALRSSGDIVAALMLLVR